MRAHVRGDEVTGLDGFAGFGGSSQGLRKAGVKIVAAANHNERSVHVHQHNFADTDHYLADLVDPSNPQKINMAGKKVPGVYMDPADLPAARFAWWSPSCVFFTRSRSKQIMSEGFRLFPDEDFDHEGFAMGERSRITMLCALRWAERHLPDVVVIENVVEAQMWGPNWDGSTYRWWLQEWANRGYEVHECFFNAMFFPPCPQSRDRTYIVFWRKGNKAPDLDYRPPAYCMSDRCGGSHVAAVQTWKRPTAAWPRPRWGRYGKRNQYLYTCPDCRLEVFPLAWPALTAIDWSIERPMIGERHLHGLGDLAPNTEERIRRCVAKWAGAPPVVMPVKSSWGVDKPVTDPLATQTSQQEKALVQPMFVKNNGSFEEAIYRGKSMHDQLGTITQAPGLSALFAGLSVERTHHTPLGVDEPLRTITGQTNGHGLVTGAAVGVTGHMHERPNQTRGRPISEQLFAIDSSSGWGVALHPAMIEMRGGGSSDRPAIVPLHTITAGGLHHGFVLMAGDTPIFAVDGATKEGLSPAMFSKLNGGPGDTMWHDVGDPLNTVTSRDTHGLVVIPWLDQYRSDPALITESMATVMTHVRHALAMVEPLPIEVVTDEVLAQVRFGMLEPDPELRRGMAFADDFLMPDCNKTQMTAGLGAAVVPAVSEWITERCLATL